MNTFFTKNDRAKLVEAQENNDEKAIAECMLAFLCHKTTEYTPERLNEIVGNLTAVIEGRETFRTLGEKK